ncbi:MAG: carboxymuconolactone decarboxylase family protein [Burkholderiales bacterium]|nr:carboxymuconolactone decarboxylase family protein [Burkholderiales bacterium]
MDRNQARSTRQSRLSLSANFEVTIVNPPSKSQVFAGIPGPEAQVGPEGFDERRRALREEFIRRRGYLAPSQEGLLALSPDFFEAYLAFSSVPWSDGTLPRKVKEFIYIAVDAATTHLYASGTRTHIRRALAEGATSDEILEVLQLTSLLGAHTLAVGLPILVDELREHPSSARSSSAPVADSERIRVAYADLVGEWDDTCEALLRLAPSFLDAYIRFVSFPWAGSTLEPGVKELIAIAINASTTHLYAVGMRFHMRRALRMGVPVDEIVEVLQLASVLGIHTCSVGVPILLDEIGAARSTTP